METSYHFLRARVRQGVLELPPSIVLPEGEEVAIALHDVPMPRDADALARTAGGWSGLVDADALLTDIFADRLLATPPPPSLPA